MLKDSISRFRLFSPVMVGGKETFVTKLPKDGDSSFFVSGDSSPHSREAIQPIPLDKAFFDRHPEVFQIVDGVYEHSGNSHIVTIDCNSMCSIDGEEFGYVYRHELIIILEDLFNHHILLPDIVAKAQTI